MSAGRDVARIEVRANEEGCDGPGRAHLMLGAARYYLDQPDQVRRSFKAAAFKDTEKEARLWLRHIRQAVTAANKPPS